MIVWFLGLILILSVVWGSISLGISPMPSSLRVLKMLKKHLPKQISSGEIYELGAGFGSVVRVLYKAYPKTQIHAYERSWVPYLFLKLRFLNRPTVHVHREDFFKASLKNAALIYTYLYPKAMERLERKLSKEGWPNAQLFSFEFALPKQKPIGTLDSKNLYHSKLYLYQLSSDMRVFDVLLKAQKEQALK